MQTPLSRFQGGRRESPLRRVPPRVLLLPGKLCHAVAAAGCLESSWHGGDPSLSGPAVVNAPAAGGEPATGPLGEEVQLVILTSAVRVWGGAEGEAKHSLQTRTWQGRAGPLLRRGHCHPLGTCRTPAPLRIRSRGLFPAIFLFLVLLVALPHVSCFCLCWVGDGRGPGRRDSP